jgi:hypothetical protein
METQEKDMKGRRGAKVLYWKLSGLSKKGEEFWDYIDSSR